MAYLPGNMPVFMRQPNAGSVAVTAAETTTLQTLYTAGPNGSKIFGIWCSSIDTANKDLVINRVTVTPTTYIMWTVPIPITSGTVDGIAMVNCMNPTYAAGLPVDNDGNPFFYLAIGDTLQVNALATLTAGKSFNVTCIAADF